jgi:cytochrome c-type biogenesis protein CcmH/NrfG
MTRMCPNRLKTPSVPDMTGTVASILNHQAQPHHPLKIHNTMLIIILFTLTAVIVFLTVRVFMDIGHIRTIMSIQTEELATMRRRVKALEDAASAAPLTSSLVKATPIKVEPRGLPSAEWEPWRQRYMKSCAGAR